MSPCSAIVLHGIAALIWTITAQLENGSKLGLSLP